MARLAIRATGDSKRREHTTTSLGRILLCIELDGRNHCTLGVYRRESGGVYVTITDTDTHIVPTIEKLPTTGYGVYIPKA